MHDGSLATLGDVVDFYDRGGRPNPNLDPEIHPRRPGVSTAVMTVAAALLLLTAAIAACIPAHRAMTIDPAVALRME